jgi:tripartite-type tricarboxylate transporter receptor subunit TctC
MTSGPLRITRRTSGAVLASCAIACLGGTFLAVPQAMAQVRPYPTRAVRLIVPFPPGGATDAAARELGDGLSRLLGQPVLVENRPGADGAIAAQAVMEAPPDGYTLLFASSSIEGVPLVQKGAKFASLNDFTPVSLVCRLGFGLVVGSQVPARSLQELVAYAKSNPGKLNFGSGSLSELMAASQFMKATGTRMVKVNYKGGAQMIPDLVSGQVQVSFGPLTPLLPMVKDRRLHLLGILGNQRATVTPDTPSLKEAGIDGVSGAGGLQAIMGPPRMPHEVVDQLSAAIRTVIADPAVQAKFVERGQEPQSSSPEALAGLLREERSQWDRFVADEGIKPE